MAKVTIQSIAKDLGLSRNTVSMALKGNDLVAQRTREMVLRYAQQRGYVASSGEEGERQPPERVAHARIYDRILERCVPILFDGKNFREENAEATKAAVKGIVSPK